MTIRRILAFLIIPAVPCFFVAVDAFSGKLPFLPNNVSSRSSSSRLSMCICIDCERVTNCAAYHFVEQKHEQPHMTTDPTFTPRDGSPTIHVNVRTVRNEDEMKRMWNEHSAETKRAEEKQKQNPSDNKDKDKDKDKLMGETVYDVSPVTTYEYDVVACDDYIQDKGCWIRNMPEEIRLANPDFVPT